MTQDEQTLLLIKGAISDLPSDAQEAIREIAENFRRVIKEAPEGYGSIALALVGAEMAAIKEA